LTGRAKEDGLFVAKELVFDSVFSAIPELEIIFMADINEKQFA
jgi:hypothetical protein